MRCKNCPCAVEPPWFNKTTEQLEAISVEIMGDAPGSAGHGSYAVDEIVRFRRGLCWGCGYDERHSKKREQAEEAERLRLAQDAMANEGGRCSA